MVSREAQGRILNQGKRFDPPSISVATGRRRTHLNFDDLGSLPYMLAQAEQVRGGIVLPQGEPLTGAVDSIESITENTHFDIVVPAHTIAPRRRDMPRHARSSPDYLTDETLEAQGSHFTKRGYRLRLGPSRSARQGKMSRSFLLSEDEVGPRGNPQRLMRDALISFGETDFKQMSGYVWHPYDGRVRAIFSDVNLVWGWRWAAAIEHGQILVKIEPNNGNPIVHIPSRNNPREVYRVKFTNLPVGEDAYAKWNLMRHQTHSLQSLYATDTTASHHGQVDFHFHEIAAFLTLGMSDETTVYRNGFWVKEKLPRPIINPFPSPTRETHNFQQTLEERVFAANLTPRGGVGHQRLSMARMQALHSARNHVYASEQVAGEGRRVSGLYHLTTRGQFRKDYVREGFRLALANHPLK